MVAGLFMMIAVGAFAFGFILSAGALDASKENSPVTTTSFLALGLILMVVGGMLFYAAIPN